MSSIIGHLAEFARAFTGLSPQSIASTTANGAAVDCKDYQKALVVALIGAIGSGSVVVQIQESADGSTGWTNVTSATMTTTTQNTTHYGSIDQKQRKRYLRASITTTGTSSAGVAILACQKSPAPSATSTQYSYAV